MTLRIEIMQHTLRVETRRMERRNHFGRSVLRRNSSSRQKARGAVWNLGV